MPTTKTDTTIQKGTGEIFVANDDGKLYASIGVRQRGRHDPPIFEPFISVYVKGEVSNIDNGMTGGSMSIGLGMREAKEVGKMLTRQVREQQIYDLLPKRGKMAMRYLLRKFRPRVDL